MPFSYADRRSRRLALRRPPRRTPRAIQQADHHHRAVRTRQRHRHHHPRRRPAARRRAQAERRSSRTVRAPTARWRRSTSRARPPDGYTLLMTTNWPHSAAPFLMKNVAYDPVKDFTAVTRHRQLHADAGGASQRSGEDRQGADRPRQGQSGQAVVRQRQHRGRGGRRDAQALGEARHAARALQERAAGHPGPAGRPGVDDVRSTSPPACRTSRPKRCARWR